MTLCKCETHLRNLWQVTVYTSFIRKRNIQETMKEKLETYFTEISKCLLDAIVQISVNPCKDAEFKFNLMILTFFNFLILSCKFRFFGFFKEKIDFRSFKN